MPNPPDNKQQEVPQPAEQSVDQKSPAHHVVWHTKQILIVAGGIIFLMLFAYLNYRVYTFAQNTATSQAKNLLDFLPKRSNPAYNDLAATTQNQPANPTATRAPTPTRKQGPGTYACDPFGVCGSYKDPIGYGECPKTYADKFCLDECENPDNWCKN